MNSRVELAMARSMDCFKIRITGFYRVYCKVETYISWGKIPGDIKVLSRISFAYLKFRLRPCMQIFSLYFLTQIN